MRYVSDKNIIIRISNKSKSEISNKLEAFIFDKKIFFQLSDLSDSMMCYERKHCFSLTLKCIVSENTRFFSETETR